MGSRPGQDFAHGFPTSRPCQSAPRAQVHRFKLVGPIDLGRLHDRSMSGSDRAIHASQLDLDANVVLLAQQLCDIPSVSGNEGPIADAIQDALSQYPHLEVCAMEMQLSQELTSAVAAGLSLQGIWIRYELLETFPVAWRATREPESFGDEAQPT
jgi:hypothetical protein